MSLADEFRYRRFLFQRAVQKPVYTVASGLGGAVSLLLTLHSPVEILFGLVPTAAFMYIAAETMVLGFPGSVRERFYSWFNEYHRLSALVPPDSGILLQGSSVDPEFILAQLQKIRAAHLPESYYNELAKEIDRAFQTTERAILEAQQTRDRIRLGEIAEGIRERTQQVHSSARTYTEAMTDVYQPEENVRLGNSRRNKP